MRHGISSTQPLPPGHFGEHATRPKQFLEAAFFDDRPSTSTMIRSALASVDKPGATHMTVGFSER
jgi:hypothetical protein